MFIKQEYIAQHDGVRRQRSQQIPLDYDLRERTNNFKFDSLPVKLDGMDLKINADNSDEGRCP